MAAQYWCHLDALVLVIDLSDPQWAQAAELLALHRRVQPIGHLPLLVLANKADKKPALANE